MNYFILTYDCKIVTIIVVVVLISWFSNVKPLSIYFGQIPQKDHKLLICWQKSVYNHFSEQNLG